jgi:hypothetical protein
VNRAHPTPVAGGVNAARLAGRARGHQCRRSRRHRPRWPRPLARCGAAARGHPISRTHSSTSDYTASADMDPCVPRRPHVWPDVPGPARSGSGTRGAVNAWLGPETGALGGATVVPRGSLGHPPNGAPRSRGRGRFCIKRGRRRRRGDPRLTERRYPAGSWVAASPSRPGEGDHVSAPWPRSVLRIAASGALPSPRRIRRANSVALGATVLRSCRHAPLGSLPSSDRTGAKSRRGGHLSPPRRLRLVQGPQLVAGDGRPAHQRVGSPSRPSPRSWQTTEHPCPDDHRPRHSG